MVEPVIDADRVGKSFGGLTVLHRITLEVFPGQAVALFGPNGAGKTTLLKLFSTALKPSHGQLRLFGEDVARSGPETRRRIGLLTHESFLYPDLTPKENLLFYGKIFGVKDLDRQIDLLLDLVGLPNWKSRPVRTFSRGMEQRLALARTFLHTPDLLLLDEPYSGLDLQGIERVQALLSRARTQGKTVVTATHDVASGVEICDRALILVRGEIVWESTASLRVEDITEVYRTYGAVEKGEAKG